MLSMDCVETASITEFWPAKAVNYGLTAKEPQDIRKVTASDTARRAWGRSELIQTASLAAQLLNDGEAFLASLILMETCR